MSLSLYLIPQNPSPYKRQTKEKTLAPEYYTNVEDYDPVLRYHLRTADENPVLPADEDVHAPK